MLSELSAYSAHGITFDVDMSAGEILPSAMTGITESSHLTLRGFLSFLSFIQPFHGMNQKSLLLAMTCTVLFEFEVPLMAENDANFNDQVIG